MSRCPSAYTAASAARLRETGGVGGKTVDRDAVDKVSRARWTCRRRSAGGSQGSQTASAACEASILPGSAICLETMWDLAMEIARQGTGRSLFALRRGLDRAVRLSLRSRKAKRDRVAELLNRGGYSSTNGGLLGAVDAWRRERTSPMGSVKALGARGDRLFRQPERSQPDAVFAEGAGERAAGQHRLPAHQRRLVLRLDELPGAQRVTPMATPQYEASYEINASLQISFPEFQQLVSHEVVPGHVTTFAYLQNLYVRSQAGFEATVLTMNTRAATLFEGIANNAILIAHGVNSVEQLPDEDMQIGVLLALLQDDAKNQSSYLTWGEGKPQAEDCDDPAPRLPGQRRARRQALWRVGTASAAGPHVSAGVSRRHGQGRGAAADVSSGARAAGDLRLLRDGGYLYRGRGAGGEGTGSGLSRQSAAPKFLCQGTNQSCLGPVELSSGGGL